jgi:uncharacterized DUF497 family protein
MDSEILYIFNSQKNAKLLASRGVGFEDVISSIHNNKILDVLEHPNREKYPDQWILIVEIDDYAYQVPFCYEGDNIRLITVFPSRKCTRQYLGGE